MNPKKNQSPSELTRLKKELADLKAKETALSKENHSLRQLYNQAPLPYQSMDKNGILLEVNQAWLDSLGYSKSEVIGKNFGDFLHPDWQDHFKENFPKFKTLGEVLGAEYEILKKDGSTLLVSCHGKISRDPQGRFKQTHCIFHDISRFKCTEEALQQSEARYRRITEGLVDYQYTVRMENGRAVETQQSPTCLAVTGYTAEEFAADPYLWIHMVAIEDRERVRTHVQQILKGEDVPPIEHHIHRKDGALRLVRDTTILQKDAQGNLLSYDGVINDITEYQLAEEEKAKLKEQKQQIQKAESLSRMAGAIAHHFNNHLQAVMGNLELALDEIPMTSPSMHHLDSALRAANKAAAVSRLMLTYLGQTTGSHETLDFSEVCRASLPMFQAALPHNVLLKTDFPVPGPVINANEIQLQQVLTNLITNAWEAMGTNRGVVRLRVNTVSPKGISKERRFPLDWQPKNQGYACLEIADTGCGIAAADIEKIFDPFYSSKFTGRGLGLSVVLGIIRTHGGAITVESEPNQGTVFRVYMPLAAEEVSLRLEKTVNIPAIPGGGTVLLVEDDDMVLQTTKTMIETKLGFAVVTARDGSGALEIFRKHKETIRCVVCDLTMPGMDGWETLTALRQIAPGIPFVLASGYDKAQVLAGVHPQWPQAFLSKPYGVENLREAIGQALAGNQKENNPPGDV